ncbi:MAG: ferritin-like domain-containing protein [Myxococcota bacterium]
MSPTADLSVGNPVNMNQQTLQCTDVHQVAWKCLMQSDPSSKCAQTHAAQHAWQQGQLQPSEQSPAVQRVMQPGRPPKPLLVPPGQVAKRGYHTLQQRAALLHALAHIEFNAINLAWDAVYRFRGLPSAFYRDWIAVANDEARHFAMLHAHLQQLGYGYGDFTAHNGLWEMAVSTDADLVARMALVPRVLEARGLDVTPAIEKRLRQAADAAAADILATIRREEVVHVAVGTRWFHYGCKQQQLDPHTTFLALVRKHMPTIFEQQQTFDRQARLQAGFTCEELDALSGQTK